jgi:tRNA (mo5U34)-methyltransferase
MQQARNPEHTASVQLQHAVLAERGYYHSIELPDGRVIPGLQSLEMQRWRLSQFPIPDDLRGKRVLDIGAWDGWFSFEMERRGATVVAVDATTQTRFLEAKALMNSKVEHVVADICYLTPRDIGYFDIVLFFGVLYHVKHPLLALERVCELSTDLACVESFVTDDQPFGTIPTMEFYEGTELSGQFDNWVGPNISCLMAMCRTAGFARVDFKSVLDFRAHLSCHRKWTEIPRPAAPAELIVVEHSELKNHDFTARRDDYVTVWISSEESNLTIDDIFVQVGPYAARPAGVSRSLGTAWQANCKVPLGLTPGWYNVSVAVRDSEWSNRVRIPVDLPRESRVCAPTGAFKIMGVYDGHTWEQNRVRSGLDSCVSIWVGGLPDGVRRAEVSLRLDGTDLPASFVSSADDKNGAKQINAMIPAGIARGEHQLTVRFRETESRLQHIELF